MGHSSKSHNTKHSSKKSKKGSTSPYASSSKPSSSTRPTPLEQYVASDEPHQRVALGWASERQTGQQMVQHFDSAWNTASGR
ncbi:hypothetical protein E0Z10_g2412 [Xylaria hypoxylon]|uniref:Uncharacterized protein n=1 Tax=Xylaria hypoxylon TaxID=37992 RepID=A0A4Z0Z463_9PEZI|nr:hypothetical protein E0Z10_g2412 [Xylaria hypoxylon]